MLSHSISQGLYFSAQHSDDCFQGFRMSFTLSKFNSFGLQSASQFEYGIFLLRQGWSRIFLSRTFPDRSGRQYLNWNFWGFELLMGFCKSSNLFGALNGEVGFLCIVSHMAIKPRRVRRRNVW